MTIFEWLLCTVQSCSAEAGFEEGGLGYDHLLMVALHSAVMQCVRSGGGVQWMKTILVWSLC
jgi:hypothetical protein